MQTESLSQATQKASQDRQETKKIKKMKKTVDKPLPP